MARASSARRWSSAVRGAVGLAALLLGAGAAGTFGSACNPAPDLSGCYPGDYAVCTCDAAVGYALCGADGALGACDCTSSVPGTDGGPLTGVGGATSSASVGVGGAGGGGGQALLPFLAACDDDSQCASGLCFHYNAKGPHCTIPCTLASECPPPSDGCSGMAVCKAP